MFDFEVGQLGIFRGHAVSKKETHQERSQSPIKSHSLKDQLEYVADLLLELKEMASDHHLSTLAGLLDLARAEASLRAKDHA